MGKLNKIIINDRNLKRWQVFLGMHLQGNNFLASCKVRDEYSTHKICGTFPCKISALKKKVKFFAYWLRNNISQTVDTIVHEIAIDWESVLTFQKETLLKFWD